VLPKIRKDARNHSASINIIYLFFSIKNDDYRKHVAKNNYLFTLFDLNKPNGNTEDN